MKRLFRSIKCKIKAFIVACCQEALCTQTDNFQEITARLTEIEQQVAKLNANSEMRISQLVNSSNQIMNALESQGALFKDELNSCCMGLMEEIRLQNHVLTESLQELSQQLVKGYDEWHTCTETQKSTDVSFKEGIDCIHQRVDYTIQCVLNLNKTISDLERYYRARESDSQNCIDYIQSKIDFAIKRQYDIEPLLYTIFSFVQNAAIPVEETLTSEGYLYVQELHRLTEVYDVADLSKKIRVGKSNDGGYIMFEPLSREKIAYSIGISDDVSWDLDMAVRGYQIFQYDHTIDALPEENVNFHWKKIGLGKNDHDDIRSLESILSENGHQGISGMVLKMDIEGAEWEVINSCPEELFKMFDQIVFELHDLANTRKREEVLSALRILNKTHFVAHVHGNNFSATQFCGDQILPNILEITFLSREAYCIDSKSKEYLPLSIDAPNRADAPDIQLGRW